MKKYEELKKFIAQHKELCKQEIARREGKDFDSTFERGEMFAYKMIEEFTKHLDIMKEEQ